MKLADVRDSAAFNDVKQFLGKSNPGSAISSSTEKEPLCRDVIRSGKSAKMMKNGRSTDLLISLHTKVIEFVFHPVYLS